MNGTVRYWRNLGNGRFDLPRADARRAGRHRAGRSRRAVDRRRRRRPHRPVVTSAALAGYLPAGRRRRSGTQRSFQRYRVAPSFNLEDPEVKLVDLNGDGVTDAIRSGSQPGMLLQRSRDGLVADRARSQRQSLDVFPNVNFSDPRVKWGDMTGDGLQDIVLVHDGNVEYWPNLGHGDWGKRIHMRNSPRFPTSATTWLRPQRILLGDVDGDGLADIVYVDDRKVTLWINQSGNGWSEPIVIDGTPPVTDMDAVRLVDLLGSGVSGVLWSADAGGYGRRRCFFLDFTGGVKPYVLNEMDNHMGAITRVQYAPSTRFYLEDAEAPDPLEDAAALPGAGGRPGRGDRRHLAGQADHRVPLPSRLLGRRRARVPRLWHGGAD